MLVIQYLACTEWWICYGGPRPPNFDTIISAPPVFLFLIRYDSSTISNPLYRIQNREIQFFLTDKLRTDLRRKECIQEAGKQISTFIYLGSLEVCHPLVSKSAMCWAQPFALSMFLNQSGTADTVCALPGSLPRWVLAILPHVSFCWQIVRAFWRNDPRCPKRIPCEIPHP